MKVVEYVKNVYEGFRILLGALSTSPAEFQKRILHGVSSIPPLTLHSKTLRRLEQEEYERLSRLLKYQGMEKGAKLLLLVYTSPEELQSLLKRQMKNPDGDRDKNLLTITKFYRSQPLQVGMSPQDLEKAEKLEQELQKLVDQRSQVLQMIQKALEQQGSSSQL